MTIDGYEYNIQYRFLEPGVMGHDTTEWHFVYTNRFNKDNWYPSKSSVNNALAQMTASRFGYRRGAGKEYRIVHRPYGKWEVMA
jgi:hypothetical protein